MYWLSHVNYVYELSFRLEHLSYAKIWYGRLQYHWNSSTGGSSYWYQSVFVWLSQTAIMVDVSLIVKLLSNNACNWFFQKNLINCSSPPLSPSSFLHGETQYRNLNTAQKVTQKNIFLHNKRWKEDVLYKLSLLLLFRHMES